MSSITATMLSPWVKLDNISKRLGGRWALVKLSFEIARGDALLLTGSNGAGKTTLLKVIATLLQPTFGTLTVFGNKVTGDHGSVRERLALMTHATHLYDHHTAQEALLFTARILGGEGIGRINEIIERVGLATHARRPIASYSAGMKRRLMLGRLLLKQPELALLDEPWAELDSDGCRLMDEVIHSLRSAGTTLVVATHDVERARPLCSTHLHLAGGRRVD